MKNIATLILISLCIGLVACGDKQEENQEQAKRHVSSAKVYQAQGQYRAAIIEAKNAMQLMPESPDGYIALSRIYNEIGSYPAVQNLLELVVKKNPQVATELANAYYLNRKHLTAINTVTSYPADAASPEDKQRQAWIKAMSNISLGNKDGYELALAELKALGGTEADIKYVEANYLISKGEIEKAQAALAEMLATA